MILDKGGYVSRISGFANVVGDIEGEEVTRRDEAIHGREIDVVGIEEVFAGPAEVWTGARSR